MASKEKKEKMGRPNAYETIIKPRMDEIIAWCESGLVDEDICANLGIHRDTWYRHKKEQPDFSDAVTRAKQKADDRVVNALFQRCIGFEYEETTKEPAVALILAMADKDKAAELLAQLPQEAEKSLTVAKIVKKLIVPDYQSIKFWLMNRQRGRWADKTEIEHKGDVVSTIVIQGLYGKPGEIPAPAGTVVVGNADRRNAIAAAAGANGSGNGNGNGHN
jgi:hypothetical protein